MIGRKSRQRRRNIGRQEQLGLAARGHGHRNPAAFGSPGYYGLVAGHEPDRAADRVVGQVEVGEVTQLRADLSREKPGSVGRMPAMSTSTLSVNPPFSGGNWLPDAAGPCAQSSTPSANAQRARVLAVSALFMAQRRDSGEVPVVSCMLDQSTTSFHQPPRQGAGVWVGSARGQAFSVPHPCKRSKCQSCEAPAAPFALNVRIIYPEPASRVERAGCHDQYFLVGFSPCNQNTTARLRARCKINHSSAQGPTVTTTVTVATLPRWQRHRTSS